MELRALVQKRIQERETWTVNGAPEAALTSWQMLKLMAKFAPQLSRFRPPSQQQLDKEFPVLSMDWAKLKHPPENYIQITWLGHASLLVQMSGCNMLADPVFSRRCSPYQWFGPIRYRPPPCSVADLCDNLNVDAVLISHNHYDHLDCNTVREIVRRSPDTAFVVPLGLREWFQKHVSKDAVIHELDWREHFDFQSSSGKKLRIEALPVRHWSNRTGDKDQTLWCGYGVTSASEKKKKRFLFTGDTAWFDQLSETCAGPWDVAAIPVGAYEPRDFMKYNHINVEEAVRMKDAVQAAAAVPIHWGTFPLTGTVQTQFFDH
jgi:N-acyl-phosphatidylethanolamine-hydrolysing phospholipase D